jgi:hypothetical protein
MKRWKKCCMGLALAAGLTPAAWGQIPIGTPPPSPIPGNPGAPPPVAPPPGAPGGPPAPPNIFSFLCMTPEQKAAKKAKFCACPIGQLINNGMKPVSVFSGGLFGPCCPPVNALDLLLPPDSAGGAAARIKADEAAAKQRRADIRYLGTVDCHYWPEARDALIGGLRGDRNECVRWEAAHALLRGCCCTKETIKALSITVTGSEEDGLPSETSCRVRDEAAAALEHCLACLVANHPHLEMLPPPVKEKETPPKELPPPKEPITPTAYYHVQVEAMPIEKLAAEARQALMSREVVVRANYVPGRDHSLMGIISGAMSPGGEVVQTAPPPEAGPLLPLPAPTTGGPTPTPAPKLTPVPTAPATPPSPTVVQPPRTTDTKPPAKVAPPAPPTPATQTPLIQGVSATDPKPVVQAPLIQMLPPADPKPAAPPPLIQMLPAPEPKPAPKAPLIQMLPPADPKPVAPAPQIQVLPAAEPKPVVRAPQIQMLPPADPKPAPKPAPAVLDLNPTSKATPATLDAKPTARTPPPASTPAIQQVAFLQPAPTPAPTPVPVPAKVAPAPSQPTPGVSPMLQPAPTFALPPPRMSPTPTVHELLGTLKEAVNPEHREWAAANLANPAWRDNVLVGQALLNAACQDAAPTVRVESVRSLARLELNTVPVYEALQKLKADRDPRVQREAQLALGKLFPAQAAAPVPSYDTIR